MRTLTVILLFVVHFAFGTEQLSDYGKLWPCSVEAIEYFTMELKSDILYLIDNVNSDVAQKSQKLTNYLNRYEKSLKRLGVSTPLEFSSKEDWENFKKAADGASVYLFKYRLEYPEMPLPEGILSFGSCFFIAREGLVILDKNEQVKTQYIFQNSSGPYIADEWVKFSIVKKKDGDFKCFYNNGKEQIQGTILDGSLNGDISIWYENGQLQSKFNCKRGKIVGKYESWYSNGKKRLLCHFSDNSELLSPVIIYSFLSGEVAKEISFESISELDETQLNDLFQ